MKSPCIGVCKLDPKGRYCMGCARTIEQITNQPKEVVRAVLAQPTKVN